MTRLKKYSREWFIKKFDAIPDELWGMSELNCGGKKCALGHCGLENYEEPTKESLELVKLFGGSVTAKEVDFNKVYIVNDDTIYKTYGDTPKERIIKFLSSEITV